MADMIEKGKGISSEMFLSELESQTTKIQNINHQIKDYDAILTISTASSAPLRNEVEKNDPSLAFTYLGMPSLHVPNSKDSLGMPIGFQITSAKYNDYLILQLLDLLVEKNYVSNQSLLNTIKPISLDG